MFSIGGSAFCTFWRDRSLLKLCHSLCASQYHFNIEYWWLSLLKYVRLRFCRLFFTWCTSMTHNNILRPGWFIFQGPFVIQIFRSLSSCPFYSIFRSKGWWCWRECTGGTNFWIQSGIFFLMNAYKIARELFHFKYLSNQKLNHLFLLTFFGCFFLSWQLKTWLCTGVNKGLAVLNVVFYDTIENIKVKQMIL